MKWDYVNGGKSYQDGFYCLSFRESDGFGRTIVLTKDDARRLHEDTAAHARWKEASYGGCESLYRCSHCEQDTYVEDLDEHGNYVGIQFKYCPKCGAKMDEEEH